MSNYEEEKELRKKVTEGQIRFFSTIAKRSGWVITRKADSDEYGWAFIDARVTEGSHATVFFSKRNGEKKTEISGSYRGSSYSNPRPSIGVSMEKGVDRIVKDIARRFLPDFLEWEKEVNKVEAEGREYGKKTAEGLKLLKGSEPTEVETRNNTLWIDEGEIYGTVKVAGDSVTLELRCLKAAQAKAILDSLKKGVAA